MMVNGVEQVRTAMLAVPGELDRTPPEGDAASPMATVAMATDERVCASIRQVAEHIGDKVPYFV